jgi:hypothetical protein
MDRRALRRFALALTFWVGAAALVPAHFALTICRFAGLVHFDAGGSCCAGAAASETPTRAAIESQRCCSLRSVHLEVAPIERHATTELAALPAPRSISTDAPAALPVVPIRPRPASFALGPPLILAKQSFLI